MILSSSRGSPSRHHSTVYQFATTVSPIGRGHARDAAVVSRAVDPYVGQPTAGARKGKKFMVKRCMVKRPIFKPFKVKPSMFRLCILSIFAIASAILAVDPVFAAGAAAAIPLVSHRAIYDLRLGHTHGQRAVESVRGRIIYDFSGNACEGYALRFRQVSELNNGEGKVSLSDLRTATWEDGDAKKFQFNSENYADQRKVDSVDGRADRTADNVVVKLSKPKDETLDLTIDTVFPTEHIRRIIEAARAGQTILDFPVYDGSETGEKVFNTMTVIGREIRPGDKKPSDAAAGKAVLKGLKRWPVTVSYFEKAKTEASGEQTPAYTLSFELYENGISRALILDYGDFTVVGDMTQLDIKDAAPCK
jgi:hypothetical protein